MASTDRDPTDTNFMIFLIVAFLFIAGLAFTIFPRHEATASATPAATREEIAARPAWRRPRAQAQAVAAFAVSIRRVCRYLRSRYSPDSTGGYLALPGGATHSISAS